MADDSNIVMEPLRSSYADDADMADLVEYFLMQLPGHLSNLEAAFTTHDREQLQVLAHQLKGSGSSYGFESITHAAASLETEVIDGVADIRASVNELMDLCRRAVLGGK